MNKSKIEWCDMPIGNKILCKDGYIIASCPGHPFAKPNGYVFEHRIVMERNIKRFLKKDEHIHHLNGDKADNRIENLIIVTKGNHRKLHWEGKSPQDKREQSRHLVAYQKAKKLPRDLIECACGCGEMIVSRDKQGREHIYKLGHNNRGKNWVWGKKAI